MTTQTWRPPSISRKLRNITYWTSWHNGDRIGKQVEMALIAFLQSEIDEIIANENGNSSITKEGMEFMKWLRQKEDQLYGEKKK